jgi:charged multivesicular body protein 4A/B
MGGSYPRKALSTRRQNCRCRLAVLTIPTAAKNALRRKKVHERSLEQTAAQIAQVEQQIYSIEAANINQETLNAMKNAGAAMKQIHGGLTIDKVDATMYALLPLFHSTTLLI